MLNITFLYFTIKSCEVDTIRVIISLFTMWFVIGSTCTADRDFLGVVSGPLSALGSAHGVQSMAVIQAPTS